MSGTRLYIAGKPIALGKRIGRGGEGEVFALADRPDVAVKLYMKPDAHRRDKIEAMVAAGLAGQSDLIAFPLAAVQMAGDRFAGFTMRLVKGHKPLFELYAPGARKIAFPDADFRFLVRAATNVAVAVAKVHEASAVVGDINHSGILVSDQAVAALIDADSFQFGSRYLCRVGVPEYTSPELQGRKLDGIVRTAEHDAFGLAVVIFQLLFMGRHPFAGRFRGSGDMPIEKAIGEYRFAYSRSDTAGMSPPPGAARLQDFPDEIAAMFEAAFGRRITARPKAEHWAHTLRKLEGALSRCSHEPLHYFPSVAGRCLWCRMEREAGVVLFVPSLPKGKAPPDLGSLAFNLASVWSDIQAVRLPAIAEVKPVVTPLTLQPSEAVRDARKRDTARRRSGLAVLVLAAALLGWSGYLWLMYLPLGWWGYHLVWGSDADGRQHSERLARAEVALDAAIESWRRRTGELELAERRYALERAKGSYERLPAEEQRRLSEFASKRRQNQLKRHLESFPLRKAKVRGIGTGKLATLASYGIDTAAQVRRDRIKNIPGFGPVNSEALLAWRASVEMRFVFNPAPTMQDQQNEERVRREVIAEGGKLRRELVTGAADLRAAAAAVTARLGKVDPAVDKAHFEFEQARINAESLGLC